jgi:hypothetical protein
MADSPKNGKQLPPYAAYSSLSNLMKRLQKDLPAHVTRSIVSGSNSAKATMMVSLLSLGLINDENEPTDLLKRLVASEADYPVVLKDVIQRTYPWLFDGTIDLAKTTTEKVAEKMREIGTGGSTTSKCISFLLAAAKEAGLTVSPYLKPLAIAKPAKKKNARMAAVPDEIEQEDEEEDDAALAELQDKERIVVSVHGMDDWIIHVPKDLTPAQWRHGLKMAKFILDNYRPDPNDADPVPGGAS